MSISEAGSSQQGAASHDGEDGAPRAASGRVRVRVASGHLGDNAVSEGVRAAAAAHKAAAAVGGGDGAPPSPTGSLTSAAAPKGGLTLTLTLTLTLSLTLTLTQP